MRNQEISAKLKLREHTVRNYLFRIFDKLGISNRVELVLYAVSGIDQADVTVRLDPGLENSTGMKEVMLRLYRESAKRNYSPSQPIAFRIF